MRPYADHDAYDAWTDEVSVGTFDEGFIPARLSGRRNKFTNVTAHLPRRDPASPALGDAPHGKPSGDLLPSLGSVAPTSSDGVPWSRDAA